ncbi:MAG: UDP-galactopyranose mutase [Prevotellaceae bacterium]|nr:UDP-galactopyranose mutase [Prevotellaceae bacterium]
MCTFAAQGNLKNVSKMKRYDYLIVGAGLTGATFAYRVRQAGRSCLVIDRRWHTGGNIRCEEVQGINVHRYGAHIFHTSSERVWRFVNSLVPFNRFTNSPLAVSGGRLYNLPFNMNTFHQMWGVTTPAEALEKISAQRAAAIERMRQEGATEPRNLEEQALSLVGEDIYKTLVKGYTEKQWGRPCTELPAFIIKRLPVRLTYDNNYFNDLFQGIPKGGYNRLTDALLEGVECLTGVDYLSDRTAWRSRAERVVYTGALDEYFGYRLGKLEYRSLSFEQEIVQTSNYQGNAVVNYTDHSEPFTRIIEHKHFEMSASELEQVPVTVLTREYPSEWTEGKEPYYPINDERNNALAAQYKELAKGESGVLFAGRLAEYRYYDMAPLVEKVLDMEV